MNTDTMLSKKRLPVSGILLIISAKKNNIQNYYIRLW